jgi:hypothetical protein
VNNFSRFVSLQGKGRIGMGLGPACLGVERLLGMEFQRERPGSAQREGRVSPAREAGSGQRERPGRASARGRPLQHERPLSQVREAWLVQRERPG